MKKNTLTALCLVLALILSLCGCSGEKEEAYRMIQVLEVSGSVSVERETMGAMDAYEGMRLESGDKITVGGDSWLKMKMDGDKYALVEPDSVLRLEASGSSADSKTVLHLESGAVSNRLESKLGDGSSYEVNTPNSTMAVRGTVFRVEVTWNDGISVSGISVYDGKVASRLIYPDGTADGEAQAVLLLEGTAAQVWSDETRSRYVTTEAQIDLEDLKLKTLHFLEEAFHAGMELNIPEEELEELIAALEQESAAVVTGETMETTEETTAPTGETTEPTEKTTVPTTAPAAPGPTAPAPEEDGAGEEEEETEETTETTAPSTFTVTFQYNGVAFATQTVTSGNTAAKPTLQPTPSGTWEGLDTPITGDTTISWIAN